MPDDESIAPPDPLIADEVEGVDKDDHRAISPLQTPLASNGLLPNEQVRTDDAANDEHPLVVRIPIGTPLAELDRLLVLKTISATGGNKQQAARILGISRRGLYVRLAAYGEADSAADPPGND
jgi:DNA-binding NtrC family response regulator